MEQKSKKSKQELQKASSFPLTLEEIQNIAGIPIDHSFLQYKKELTEYGIRSEKYP